MLHHRGREQERGQILILFTLVVIVIFGFIAIVVDLGLLRNNRQSLANALDAGALAGGTLLPVDGSGSGGPGAVAAIVALINREVQATYPGLRSGTDYQIAFRCLIGTVSGQPAISRDIPGVCNPRNALGHTPVASDFIGAGKTRSSVCDPSRGDRCNAVVLTGSVTNAFTFGRAVGVNQGSTGSVVSAACNGPCGEPPFIPLDVVVIIDRTGSMAGDETNLRNATRTILSTYDPNIQHIALGALGPSTLGQDCPGTPTGRKGVPLTVGGGGPSREGVETDDTNGAANTISIDRPNGTSAGDVMLAQILYDETSSGVNIAVPTGWRLVRQTNSGTSLAQSIYYKVATGSEPNSYTWRFRTAGGSDISTEAAGGIVTYANVDTSDPFAPAAADGSIGTGNSGNGANLSATGVTPGPGDKQVVVFFGVENDTSISTPSSMTERYENQVNNSGSAADLTVAMSDDPLTASGATGNKTATAGSSNPWVANLVVLRGQPSEYGTDVNADIDKWILQGLTGLTGSFGSPDVSEAYSTGGTINNNSRLARVIDCVTNDLSSTGTNLATPMRMATEWLIDNARPGVKQGIIFESDGTPNYNGDSGDPQNYRCDEAIDAAQEAKDAGIEIFTIAFDIVGERCPDSSKLATTAMAEMASGPIIGGTTCNTAENQDGDHFFCEPGGADLSAVFQSAAVQLAGLRSHLVPIYPAPYVSSIGPNHGNAAGGNSITITGSGFTGATRVQFGGAPSTSFTVLSDTSISARVPPGSSGSTVHVRVTSPGGTSPTVTADQYRYD